MTIVTQDRELINYDYVRSVDYVILTAFVGVRAQYADSEDCVFLGQYINMGAAQTAVEDLSDALEDGAALFRMPPC